MKKPRSPNKIGRKRRAAGWTLLALGVVVAGVWVASGWWRLAHQYNNGAIVIERATVWWDWHADFQFQQHWQIVTRNDNRRINWLGWGRKDHESYSMRRSGIVSVWWSDDAVGGEIVLWPIPLLLCTPAALLLRSGILARRRAIAGSCTKCGYSLAGIAKDAPCPECGGKRIS